MTKSELTNRFTPPTVAPKKPRGMHSIIAITKLVRQQRHEQMYRPVKVLTPEEYAATQPR